MINYENVPLSNHTKEIILGSILGDGSLKIHPKYKNARFSFRHSLNQKEYFLWKINNLKEISAFKSVFLQKEDKGYSKKDKLRFQSRALTSLTELYNITNKNNSILIRRKWLNHMTALSLAVWWFDDGSIIANGRKGVFCTDGFNKEDVKLLAQYLLKVWDIKTTVAPVGKKRDGTKKEYWRIWIRSTDELKKLLRIIIPYTPTPSMLYKVILLYKENQLQQRWISEIRQNTNFSQKIIEKSVKEKKNKWKNFRE